MKNLPKVRNMLSDNNRKLPNQYIIETDNATLFQSYETIIAKREGGQLYLDESYWDYSPTTAKYRNRFTGLDTKETKARIKSGEVKLVNLNNG